jgi:hypothetical protein
MIKEYRLPRTITHSVHRFRECLVRLSVTLSRSVVVDVLCMYIYALLSGVIQVNGVNFLSVSNNDYMDILQL